MSRSYSLSFLTVQEASPVEAVEIAAACGYDFVGLRILPAAATGEAAGAVVDAHQRLAGLHGVALINQQG